MSTAWLNVGGGVNRQRRHVRGVDGRLTSVGLGRTARMEKQTRKGCCECQYEQQINNNNNSNGNKDDDDACSRQEPVERGVRLSGQSDSAQLFCF